MAVQIPHEKGQFWGKGSPIVNYRDFLLWAVQKWMNRSDSGGLKEAWVQSYSPVSANVHNFNRIRQVAPTYPTTLCRELCKNGWTDRFAVWVVDSGGLKEAQVQSYSPGGASAPTREGTLAPPGEYDWTVRLRGDAVLCQINLTICLFTYWKNTVMITLFGCRQLKTLKINWMFFGFLCDRDFTILVNQNVISPSDLWCDFVSIFSQTAVLLL